ncbi:hypothetical protein ACH436_06000 [Isoptericola sp. NPDC019693]|uniref:hypothetical protein n=1 Tax=Isoptericola sp. NPDC019693 TaxID=3364009 RepID=UPI003796CFE3
MDDGVSEVDGALPAPRAGRPFPRHRLPIAGAAVLMLACGLGGWAHYRAVGSSLIYGDELRTAAGIGCMPWDGPLQVVDAPVLSNTTGATVHVSRIQPAGTPGLRVHEVRVVPPSPEIVFGAEYDPDDPGWAGTSVVGPEGITLEPGESVQLAYVLDVDTSGGSFAYSTVSYEVGPYSYHATYPGANMVLPTTRAKCSEAAMERLGASPIP